MPYNPTLIALLLAAALGLAGTHVFRPDDPEPSKPPAAGGRSETVAGQAGEAPGPESQPAQLQPGQAQPSIEPAQDPQMNTAGAGDDGQGVGADAGCGVQ